MKTSGPVELERPRMRDAKRLGFESRVLGKGVARTHALEALIIVGFLRGLSVRDVEALLEEALGEQVVGKSTVARICQDTRERYRAWCERRLADHDLVYCSGRDLPQAAPRRRARRGRAGRLGAHAGGQKVLLGLQLGIARELRELAGLRPRAATAGCAAGADHRRRRARESGRPRGSCGRPRSSNAAPSTRSGTSPASCPSGCTARSRRATGASWTTRPRRRRAPRLLALAGDYRRAYPSAMRVIDEHVDQLVAHLRFPLEHRKRTRSTNLLERTFVEVRRRTKIIGRFPGETSALSLIWAVLELASRGWRGITMTPRRSPKSNAFAAAQHARRLDRGGDRRLTSPQRSYARVSPGQRDATPRSAQVSARNAKRLGRAGRGAGSRLEPRAHLSKSEEARHRLRLFQPAA